MAKENKKPWLAALLNFIIWGLGYLYVGERKNFGILLVIGEILLIGLTATQPLGLSELLALPGSIIISLAFAYDGYKTAK